MIEQKSYKNFTKRFHKNIKGLYPTDGQIELTYKCNMSCIHCYCKGIREDEELDTLKWKGILDEVHKEGCVWLTITGGEPLIRKDFLEIYSYAKSRGFLISVLTNGLLINKELINHFVKSPPYSIEITLHSLNEETYEDITQTPDIFNKVMKNIKTAADLKLPLILKTVGLKQNKGEISKIKNFAESLLGKKKFKFDSFIIPRLDGDKTPCLHRLSAEEIQKIEESDPDMQAQREEEFKKHKSYIREGIYKYHCNAWFKQFYITPHGELRFCHLTNKYSSNLRKIPFREGFYNGFPAVLEEKYESNSKCIACSLREFCYICPARAYLEVGDEKAPVQYFCELAEMRKARIEKVKSLMVS